MGGHRWILVGVGLCALVMVDRAAAGAQVGISQSNQKKTIACGGQEATVTGSLNDIIFTGECPAVTIKGSENTISIETVGQIRVVGTKNKVTWQHAIGDEKAPRISKSGLGNVISQAAPPARETAASGAGAGAAGAGAGSAAGAGSTAGAGKAAGSVGAGAGSSSGAAASSGKAPAVKASAGKASGAAAAGPAVVVSDEKSTRTIDCRGRGVTVMGNGNTLTLRGTCGKIDVKGNENIIAADTVSSIGTTGNNNRVTWSRAADGDTPGTSDLGNGNVIRRGTAPLP
jgi:hypothetical protein